jgi:hypothetical protein
MAVDERGAFHGAGADSEAQEYVCKYSTVPKCKTQARA